ncbi:TonB-dependent receptor [Bacteroides sp. GD17]|uniref:TonB-dependent receptor n=1 Tax=Bacteroides sp. GD17 TaxID=3139826 RepID=UPI0025F38441|nr:TonB-dependent receptor [uncultured Bacteroides sp.]
MKKKTTSSRMRGYFISLYLLISVFLVMEGTLFPLYAADYRGSENEQRVTTAQTVKEVFSYIEQNSNFVILYSKGTLSELDKKVSINMNGKKVEDILKELSSATGLEYKINDRQITVARKAPAPQPQQSNPEIKVTGQVFDENGETIPGANVTVKGNSGIGTVTDLDGNFTLSVPRGSVLVVSFIGYVSHEYTVKNAEKMAVKLVPDSQALEEVIVVGYGMQRKSSLTGSVTAIKSEKLKDVTTPSVADMLQGKVAGVAVSPVSGQPGAGVSVRIRGTGSIEGNKDPLWVIDGVVGNAVAELNPNDIETISILKDGSATALYGSRGANGVIQVTTKRGVAGASSVDVSAKFGVSTLQKGKLKMMNGAEYYDYLKTAYENANKELPSYLQPYLRNQNFDWWDVATQNALTQNYNIAYRYGNDKIKSYISADYYNEEGAIKGFDYDRFTLRVNTDYVVNPKLTLKSKISASYKETFSQEHSLSYYGNSPWDSPYNSKGELKTGREGTPSAEDAATADPRDYWYSDGGYNYLSEIDLYWNKQRTNAVDLGVGFDYKIFDFLTFESNNKFGFRNSYYDNYVDPQSTSGTSLGGSIKNSYVTSRSIYTSQMLRLLKTFNEVHEINAFLGYDYDEYRYFDGAGTAYNIYPGAEILNAGSGDPKISGSKWEERNAAYFFNGNYAYDGKYLFQASFRVDGSSRFGSNKRWAPFWSIGGGWNIHKENFISQLSFVNELKARISYGITGNLPAQAYAWATPFSTTANYANEIAFLSNYMGNPDLSWEETATLDFGLDIRLFDRVGITFDTYLKKVKNLIYMKHLSAVTGYNRQYANDGKLENKGFEITITPEIIRKKDLYWDVSFNLGYNKNKITHLPPGGGDLTMQAVAVGYPYLNWYMREWAGVDAMTGTPLWFKVNEDGQKTVTGNWNEATKVLLDSSPSPKFTGGINTNFSWKGFSFNANFIFSAGAKIYNGRRAGSLDRDAARETQPPMKLANGWNRWEKPGDIATHPQLLINGNNNADGESTRYLENGDFFKLKSLSVSYSLPEKWIKPAGLKTARIIVGGENLFTITKFSGDDPEILLSSRFSGTTNSDDQSQLYPTVRRFTVGVNVSF